MMSIINACSGAIVAGLFTVILWKLNRSASLADKKENSLTALAKGQEDMNARLDGVEKQIKELKDTNARQDAIAARMRILRFGDEVYHGAKHSKDLYDSILSDVDTYNSYCDEHKEFRNGITTSTEERILKAYKKCVASHSFLD